MHEFDAYVKKVTENIYNKIKFSLILGESGLGKSEIVNKACSNFDNLLLIDYDFEIHDSSIKENLLAKLLSKINTNTNLVLPCSYSPEEYLFKTINNLQDRFKVMFFFRNLQCAKDNDVAYIMHLMQFAKLDLNNTQNVFFMIKEDSDCDSTNYNRLKGCIIFNSVLIQPYNNNSIKEYILEQLGKYSNLVCKETDFEKLCNAIKGNLSIANVMVNELIANNLISFSKNAVQIHDLSNFSFTENIKPYIQKRFKELSLEEQKILTESSCIGIEFESDDLLKVLSIPKAFELLNNIENTSHLILEFQKQQYRFETKETHQIIRKTLDDYKDKDFILNNIGMHFLKALTSHLKENDYNRYIKYLLIAKEMFQEICNISNLSICYRLLIGNKISTKLYSEAIEASKEFKLFISQDSDLMSDKIINSMCIIYCALEIGDYFLGLSEICEIERYAFSHRLYLIYAKALCLYGVSDCDGALNLLLSNLKKLEKGKDKLLYAKSLSLISSLYDFKNEWELQIEYYTKAMSLCKEFSLKEEYYALQRQSGMVYPYEIALKNCQSAEKYYTETNNIRELGKVTHNIGMDSLYMCNYELSQKKCEESINYFNSIGNIEIANPINLKGILLCVKEKKYEDGLKQFLNCTKIRLDRWGQCISFLNISSAYRKLGNFDECLRYLDRVKDINNNTMIVITIAEKLCRLFYNYEKHNHFECNRIFDELLLLGDKMEYRHIYALKLFSEKTGIGKIKYDTKNIPQTNFINNSCTEYIERCMCENCFWATTRFWEN